MSAGASQGPAVDRSGAPVIDPTDNVLRELAAATRRLDDLMAANKELQREITSGQNELATARFNHLKEVADLRAQHAKELAEKETQRLDSIRAVDIGAVGKASEVSTAQAATLATQVATSAETLRTQVATSAAAAATSLSQTVEPILATLESLRRTQYEQQGQQAQRQESRVDQRAGTQNNQWLIGVAIGIAFFVATEVSKRVG